ncbi:MAG: glutamate racemase [Treponema sp. CETP13]|nr:MAG: glutamate racemase [Treponema sp. CETP13]
MQSLSYLEQSPIPIDFAFLDSGTGGLPYMQYLKDVYKDVSCMYLADTQNFPYGEKTPEKIIESAIFAVSAILKRYKPAAIVIACNTMSVTALESLRNKFPQIPFVGTVPAIKLAAKITKNKRIGLLATRQTVTHPYTKKLESEFTQNCVVVERGDPDLINFIEHSLDTATKSEIEAAIMPAISFFKSKHVDVLVLGCTHFLRIANIIQELADKITVIDSRDGVVRQAFKVANKAKFMHKQESKGDNKISPSVFYITGKEPYFGFYEKVALKAGIIYGGII